MHLINTLVYAYLLKLTGDTLVAKIVLEYECFDLSSINVSLLSP